LLEGFDVGACSVPPDNLARFIAERFYPNQKPSVDSVIASKPDLAFSRAIPAEERLALCSSVFAIVRMKGGLIAEITGFGSGDKPV
jgi:hypothetical protein